MTKLSNDDITNEETTDEWDEAFDDFYENELKDDLEDDKSSEDSDDDSESEDTEDTEDTDGEEDGEEDSEDEDEKNNSGEKNVVENNDDKEDEEDPSLQQRTAVKDALKEVYNEQQQAEAEMQETIAEALSIVRPDGINDPRVDSDGDKIEGPEDVEALYNPNTGELFTPAEARKWYKDATERYESELASAREEAEHVARVNQKLAEGREAVMRNYGDFIKENPQIAQKVLTAYMATTRLGGEGENQYIADAPVDILSFYNDVMYPYVELVEKQKEAREAAAAAAKKREEERERGKAHRDESRDFTTSVGDEATKDGNEVDWDDAFKQYYGGK